MQIALRTVAVLLFILSMMIGLTLFGVVMFWGASPLSAPFLYLACLMAFIGPAVVARVFWERLPLACVGYVVLISASLMMLSLQDASFIR